MVKTSIFPWLLQHFPAFSHGFPAFSHGSHALSPAQDRRGQVPDLSVSATELRGELAEDERATKDASLDIWLMMVNVWLIYGWYMVNVWLIYG